MEVQIPSFILATLLVREQLTLMDRVTLRCFGPTDGLELLTLEVK